MFQHQGSHLLLDNLLPFSKMCFIRTYPGEVKVLQQGLSSGGNGLLWKAQDERGEDPAWNVWNKSDVEKWKWKTQEILEDGRAWKMSQTLKVRVETYQEEKERRWQTIKVDVRGIFCLGSKPIKARGWIWPDDWWVGTGPGRYWEIRNMEHLSNDIKRIQFSIQSQNLICPNVG